MKRLLIILCTLFTLPLCASAQSIIIGDKTPEMSVRKWLMDSQPSDAEYRCLLFYHSKSELCKQNLKIIKGLIGKYDGRINLSIITKEDYREAGVSLTEHLKEYIGVAFDDNGKTFRDFGVKFIPYCIICNKKRIVWCGNAALLNEQRLEKIITK